MAKILYHAVPTDWRKEQKYAFLEKTASVAGIKWHTLKPDGRHNWFARKGDTGYKTAIPIGSKAARASGGAILSVFRTYSLGVSTNRDEVVYDFDETRLTERVEKFTDEYNAELHRWQRNDQPKDIDNFVSYESVKWSETLKKRLAEEVEAQFDGKRIRSALYRPFTRVSLYYAPLFVDRPGSFTEFFPTAKSQKENRVICLSDIGLRSPFSCLVSNAPPDLHLCASTDGFQCFPLYTYSEDGTHRRDNIPLSALVHFQNHYEDDAITRLDVFHYVYALLHHPDYRARYAENLKRELPRIPLVGCCSHGAQPPCPGTKSPRQSGAATGAEVFRAFAKAGKRLAELHLNYEAQKEYPLQRIENEEVKLNWRVEAMKLSKNRTSLYYNDFLTLAGIPAEVFDYRLGNRSALEWVIDQYRVTRDEAGHIVSDPNRADDEEYIVRLIGQVITVSLETSKLLKALPPLK